MSAGGAADPNGALVERLQRELRTVAALEVHPLIHPSTAGIASTPPIHPSIPVLLAPLIHSFTSLSPPKRRARRAAAAQAAHGGRPGGVWCVSNACFLMRDDASVARKACDKIFHTVVYILRKLLDAAALMSCASAKEISIITAQISPAASDVLIAHGCRFLRVSPNL